MLLWFEFAAVILLAFSQPLWPSLFPFLPESGAQPSPAVLLLCSLAFLASAAGLLLSLPAYRRLPCDAWFGWRARVRKDRTPSLPEFDPLFGLTYAPLFQPRKIRAGRMLVRGMDSSAALSACVCALLACAALVASCVAGDSPAGLLIYAGMLAVLTAAWSAAVLLCIRRIARQKADEPAEGAAGRRFPVWILQLPLLLLLYGFTASLLPILRLSLDKAPAVGAARVFYPFVRAGFLTIILYLLLHAPAKLALLAAPRKTHLSPVFFYAAAFLGYFVNLLLDAFRAV